MEALNKESKLRKERRHAQIEKLKTEQMEFLTRCRDLAQKVILIPEGADTDKPLDHAYKLFESVVSSLQTQLQEKKEENIEHTSVLLRNQYTTFSKAHKVLK